MERDEYQRSQQVSRFEKTDETDRIDEKLGYSRFLDGEDRVGWLVNMHATVRRYAESPDGRNGVDLYFIKEDGSTFKATYFYEPYFYVICKPNCEAEVEDFLRRKFKQVIVRTEIIERLDLSLPNHLTGNQQTAIKLYFHNTSDLQTVKKFLSPVLVNSSKNSVDDTNAAYESMMARVCANNHRAAAATAGQKAAVNSNIIDKVINLREHDVPYYVRAAIDNDIYVGCWYKVGPPVEGNSSVTLQPLKELVHRAEPVVLAFDIETTKLPLKFPDASFDAIMMISYMVDGQGYLITNREIVSADIEDFEYTPKPEFEGPFTVFNEPNEVSLIQRFFEHIQQTRPAVYVTYNGDFFDWPFIETRALSYGISMYQEIGVYKDEQGEYKSTYASHMDCLRWVKRDSYLPVGSQGLKAVTTAKLGYNPMELDPEDMTPFARDQPQTLAQYSVSDAVATFYLYDKYVNPFVFSLCNIIPMNPDEVLRKGSGTLCETLLMVQATKAGVLYPNKHVHAGFQFFEGHLLEQETYVGGHVEALQAGVFRSDMPLKFALDGSAFGELAAQLNAAVEFFLKVEANVDLEDVANYDEVLDSVRTSLTQISEKPNRFENPLVYHLDVAAMYPNIILTNRMQPDAIVNESQCSACDYNGSGADCQRRMEWDWRGEYFPLQKNEFDMLTRQLSQERFPGARPDVDPPRIYRELSVDEQNAIIKSRVTDYSRKVHNRLHVTKVVRKRGVVCQRENPFYIDTVRLFRDRRYEYKALLKKWKGKLDSAGTPAEGDEAKKMIVVYDSLQLAHKCILNSFYGYVMRKGSRWHSMEMAAMVCYTGAQIIQLACSLVERIGQPLELDTDGIWCVLPCSFPENYTFKLKNGKSVKMSYPCVMLNYLVHSKFTNHQYQELDADGNFVKRSENSIFFEVDGPYRAMILPASTEEGKLLKKRYAVFNDDGSLAELKGFEVKRRGELKLIKIFQSELFKIFLQGDSLQGCYDAVGQVANRWLDVLFSHGKDISDHDLFDLISENRSMSKSLTEYGNQKSTSICTARRLAEFLGADMVKDRGLACQFIISNKPTGLPVSERAIPVAIFQAAPDTQMQFLRRWLRDSSLSHVDIRDLLDWQYYIERFGAVIQKLITIPAAMQLVNNPVPRIPHPEWLQKRLRSRDSKSKQTRLINFFQKRETGTDDIEDIAQLTGSRISQLVLQESTSVNTDSQELLSPKVAATDAKKLKHLWKTDYRSWLIVAKGEWRRCVAEMKAISSIYDMRGRQRQQAVDTILCNDGVAVSSVVLSETENLLLKPWQVIQIVESSRAGEVRAWILVDQKCHQITLNVPRVFYVDLGLPPNAGSINQDQPLAGSIPEGLADMVKKESDLQGCSFSITIVKRTLPRGGFRKSLLRVEVAEGVHAKLERRFQSFFLHRKVAGVYETQVPLIFRAVAQVGAISVVTPERAKQQSLLGATTFELKDVKSEYTVTQSYIGNPKKSFGVIYIYHVNEGPLHFFGLFLPNFGLLYAALVDPSKQQSVGPLGKLYADRRTCLKASQFLEYPNSVNWACSVHVNAENAIQALSKQLALLNLSTTSNAASQLLVLQSNKPLSYFARNCSWLLDWPTVAVPEHKKDCKFGLDWQRYAGRRFIQRILQLDQFLDARRMLAEFAKVPLGNIERDACVSISDVAFARKLLREDALWWCSPSGSPDLGVSSGILSNFYSTLDQQRPELNYPLGYGNCSVELALHDLPINALLVSHLLDSTSDSDSQPSVLEKLSGSLEPATVYVGDPNARLMSSSGEFQVTPSNISLLKSLVKEWHNDERPNSIAHSLLSQFWRWISNPGSLFYDPALVCFLFELQRKVFALLAAAFEQFGLVIVYASFQKFVLCSNRQSTARGVEHVEFVVRSILEKPVFKFLNVSVESAWEYLLWLGPFNYGAIKTLADSKGATEAEAAGDKRKLSSDVDLASQVTVEMMWHIGEYLPLVVQKEFETVIGEYLYRMHEFRATNLDCIAKNSAAAVKKAKVNKDKGSDTVGEFADFQKEWVTTLMHRKLLKVVSSIYDYNSYCERMASKMQKDVSAISQFPSLPGSHLSLNNPALEFVKTVCRVLSLEANLEQPVRVLKRTLLTLIKVGEFSRDASFVNPCELFVLANVVCDYCSLCRDIDFCRDPEFMVMNKPWYCPGCGTSYDKGAIEQQLVHSLHTKLQKFQLQDLVCPKCNLCKPDTLSMACSTCSATYVNSIPTESLMIAIQVFKSIAQFHNMKFLSEVVSWLTGS